MISDVASSSRHLWRWLRFRVLRLWYVGFYILMVETTYIRKARHRFSVELPAIRGGSKVGLGAPPPYCWCINGNMGRVREKKRWKKEEKNGEMVEEEEISPPSILFCIRHCS